MAGEGSSDDPQAHVEVDEHRLAAVLAGDVVGYTRLIAEDEDRTVRTLRAYQQEIELLVRQHRGRLVDFAGGDGLLAEFPSAVYAVRCGLEIQAVLRGRNSMLPAERRIEFRLGAHLGDVRVEGERLVGSGVNVAARLEPLAAPGGLCVSERVREDIRGRLEIDVEDLGPQGLKNVPDAVRAFRLVDLPKAPETISATGPRSAVRAGWKPGLVAGAIAMALLAGWWISWRGELRPPTQEISSNRIAVFPFTFQGAEESLYLREGVAHLLSHALTGVGALRRVNPQSLLPRISGERVTPETARDVAREVGAGHYILGNVVKIGDEIEVQASLFAVEDDGLALLADAAADGPEVRLMVLIQDLARQFLTTPALVPGSQGQRSRLAASTSRSLPALRSFIEAEQHFSTGDWDQAIRGYQRAIGEDPEFALAHSQLAFVGMFGPIGNDLPPLWAASAQAVELAPPGPIAERIRAIDAVLHSRADEAERRWRDIVRSDPLDGDAWWALGYVLLTYNPMRGRPISEALDPFERAQRLGTPAEYYLALCHRRIGDLAKATSFGENGFIGAPTPEAALAAGLLRSFSRESWSTEQLGDRLDALTARQLQAVAIALFEAGLYEEAGSAFGLAAKRRDLFVPFVRWSYAFYLAGRGQWAEAGRTLHELLSIDLAQPRDPAAQATQAGVRSLAARGLGYLAALSPVSPHSREDLLALIDELEGPSWGAGRSEAPAFTKESAAASMVSPVGGVKAVAGSIRARVGDFDAALATADAVERGSHGCIFGSLHNCRVWAALIRADVAYWDHRWLDAWEELARLPLWDVTAGHAQGSSNSGQPAPRYLRGEVLLALGRLEEALVWFQSLSESGAVMELAPSHLRRAEIYERLDQPERAIEHYSEFVRLWEECDPELQPQVEAAQARLDELGARVAMRRVTGTGS